MIVVPVRCPGGATVFAIIDEQDAHLAQRSWKLKKGYPVTRVYTGKRNGKSHRRDVSMHRMILGLERGDPREGDHKDRNKLHNTRSNLRVLDGAQNRQNIGAQKRNRSGLRGAHWDKTAGRWKSCVRANGRTVSLGYHADARPCGS